jgi:hypothetical protein
VMAMRQVADRDRFISAALNGELLSHLNANPVS